MADQFAADLIDRSGNPVLKPAPKAARSTFR